MKSISIAGLILIFIVIAFPSYSQEAKISIPDSVGIPGDTLTVPVNLNDVSEVASIEFIIEYDPQILNFLEINISETIIPSWNMVYSLDDNQISINIIVFPDLFGSSNLVNVNFEVKPTATVGGTTFVSFVQARLNDTLVQAQDGMITIEGSNGGSGVPGDVNGDSVVDRQDLLDLIISYRKASSDGAYKPSADFNKDGAVNRQDLNILIENFGRGLTPQ